MDDVFVSTQDAHGTPVRLTRNGLTYGEEVVAADDVTAIMQQPYDAPGKEGTFVTVLVSRRGRPQGAPPALVIEGLEQGQANLLISVVHALWRENQ
jgi:hypothetical protein